MSGTRTSMRIALALCGILTAVPFGLHAQNAPAKKPSTSRAPRRAASPRISLAPKFVPGQAFRYQMEFETTTETSRSGLASDPQGPSSLVVDWSAAVRMEVLPPDSNTPGGIRLRTTYEKSSAMVRTDTVDPAATQTTDQYKQLEGKSIEFTLDAVGNVKYVAGLEGIVDSEKASQSAHEWISQLNASAGAPPGGVTIGQSWSSEQPADSLPLAGLVWHTDSQYLRNESCHPPNPDVPNPDVPNAAPAANPPVNSPAPADCAVILANLSLIRSKTARDSTPPELRKNGVQSEGKWTGSAQSLVYVSLATGMVVSVTQTGTEQMDVRLTSNHSTSIRYSGTIATRSQVALVSEGAAGK
ncbi:MAG TPA: hypothetical protein VKT71_08090 [Candidatus Acidoferrales bacterium]|nr:hypothetical protein [Candidatus Acidoferrales bacterium]